MFKKIIRFFKILLISTVWSYLYFITVRFIFLYIWKFDILLTEYWVTIAEFWNSGGVISKFKDFMFVSSLIIIIPLWLYMLIKLIKFDYTNIIVYPVKLYNSYIEKKYGSNSSRIAFKNIGISHNDVSFEDMVKMKMKESEKGGEKELEATKIRNIIKEKIKNKK